jgi:hypothetical protein
MTVPPTERQEHLWLLAATVVLAGFTLAARALAGL